MPCIRGSNDKRDPEEERRNCSGAAGCRLEKPRTGTGCYKARHYQKLIGLIWLCFSRVNESSVIGFSVESWMLATWRAEVAGAHPRARCGTRCVEAVWRTWVILQPGKPNVLAPRTSEQMLLE